MMEPEETMVEEEEFTEEEADDTLDETLVEEEADEPDQTLDSLMGDEDQPQQKKPEQGPSEPGYIRQRIDKAVAKALEQERGNIRAEYEAQFAPLREKLLDMEAKELVASGQVKDLDIAKELVRLRNGMPTAAPAPAAPAEQPRDSQGRFVARQQQGDPVTSARIAMLQHQADAIKADGGPDVIKEFQTNEDIKRRVISGEMDFHDVAKYMKSPQRRRPPAPTRSPNGANAVNPNAISSMTDEQFERMERNIDKGARYSLR